MPLVFNGTTIPTNVANALMYNGTSITQVIYNGTTVWQQQLCIICTGWSGNALSSAGGLSVSGMNHRSASNNRGSSAWTYGSWVSMDGNGVFQSATSTTSYGYSLITTGSSMMVTYSGLGYGNGGYVTLSPTTKSWSGLSQRFIEAYYQTDFLGYQIESSGTTGIRFMTTGAGGIRVYSGWTNVS